jgi:hypothetical protein
MEFWRTQHAAGGRVVTFAAAYKTTTALDTTASKATVIRFCWDAVWRETGRSVA